MRPEAVAFLPVGAQEAHGPHLPLGTDVIIAVEMARRAAARLLERGRPAFVLPPVSYAPALAAEAFAGTVSVPRESVRAVVGAIAASLAARGLRTLCLANAHLDPEHVRGLRELAESPQPLRLVFPDLTRRRIASRLTPEFQSGSCHAGRFETSLVLAARPDLVQPHALPALVVNLAEKMRAGPVPFRSLGMDQAYCGAPAEASAEEGHATYDVLAAVLLEECGG